MRDWIALGLAALLCGCARAPSSFTFTLTGAWFDLARADSLWLFLSTAGLVLAYRAARPGAALDDEERVATLRSLKSMAPAHGLRPQPNDEFHGGVPRHADPPLRHNDRRAMGP